MNNNNDNINERKGNEGNIISKARNEMTKGSKEKKEGREISNNIYHYLSLRILTADHLKRLVSSSSTAHYFILLHMNSAYGKFERRNPNPRGSFN